MYATETRPLTLWWEQLAERERSTGKTWLQKFGSRSLKRLKKWTSENSHIKKNNLKELRNPTYADRMHGTQKVVLKRRQRSAEDFKVRKVHRVVGSEEAKMNKTLKMFYVRILKYLLSFVKRKEKLFKAHTWSLSVQ